MQQIFPLHFLLACSSLANNDVPVSRFDLSPPPLFTMHTSQRDYHQSCTVLQQLGYLDANVVPPMPPRRPLHDDPEPLGVSFFRMEVSGDFSWLCLPRTFFGKSEIRDCSFANSDLSESTLCWCDFANVDFSNGCLRGSDLRASSFERVNFSGCDLRDTDLRHSQFNDCTFDGAIVGGTKLSAAQRALLPLSAQQSASVAWQSDDGEEPGGG